MQETVLTTPSAQELTTSMNGQANPPFGGSEYLKSISLQLMQQVTMMQQHLFAQAIQPLKARLEQKRLKVAAECPAIGKDLLVQFKTGGEYATTDTNVVKNTLKPLLDRHGLNYNCIPLSHTCTPAGTGHLYKVALQFSVTDVESGYTETIPGEWIGMFIGSLDKAYQSAITNGIGKFLIIYFSIASFDRPEEQAYDANGNPVALKEKKPRHQQSSNPETTAPQPTKSELDYGRAKAVFSAIPTASEVRSKYDALRKATGAQKYEPAALKRAYIERYYQLVDLDLSEESQFKFIAENWKGVIYSPNDKHSHHRIFCLDAEIQIRTVETVDNLTKLTQFKVKK